MTKGEFIDKMWDQCSSKLLKSGCILSYLVTVHQLRNHDCEDTQGKRDLLAGMLFTMGAEDNPLLIESPLHILRVCETIGPMDNELSKVHEVEVHVFIDSVLRLESRR